MCFYLMIKHIHVTHEGPTPCIHSDPDSYNVQLCPVWSQGARRPTRASHHEVDAARDVGPASHTGRVLLTATLLQVYCSTR